jgi:hypothetical protein
MNEDPSDNQIRARYGHNKPAIKNWSRSSQNPLYPRWRFNVPAFGTIIFTILFCAARLFVVTTCVYVQDDPTIRVPRELLYCLDILPFCLDQSAEGMTEGMRYIKPVAPRPVSPRTLVGIPLDCPASKAVSFNSRACKQLEFRQIENVRHFSLFALCCTSLIGL